MDGTYKEVKPPSPRVKANVLEIITHSWILKLVKKGLKKDLDLIDLYAVLDEDSSASLGNKLEKLWNNEIMNARNKSRKPSFFKTLFQLFGVKFMLCGIYITIIEIFLSVSMSTMVGKLVIHFETNKSNNQSPVGVYLAIGLIIVLLIRSILFNNYDIIMSNLAMKARVATCNVIYNKTLRLKTNCVDQASIGQIVNLMSNDVNRFDTSFLYVPFLWIGPLEAIVSVYFLWQEVGVSSVFGVTALFVFIPLQIWLGSRTSEIRSQIAKRTDSRVQLMNEIISGVQAIKMYTWEPFFTSLTKSARNKEMDKIAKSSYIKGILSSFFLFNTRIALFVNLFSYVVFGNYVTASKVFIMTSYYNVLRGTLTIAFPPGIGRTAELFVSIKRIEDFLLCEERDGRSTNVSTVKNGCRKMISGRTAAASNVNVNADIRDAKRSSDCAAAIIVSNVTAKWTDSQTDNCLENISLTVRPGRLVAIIGAVGAGKSSLIQAILRELPISDGSISVNGVLSYAPQEPWLFVGSVRQNILFGSPVDETRYKNVIRACALETDMAQFARGDKTIVGDRGLCLSGGQRARINLARAVYKRADIYLLDDPLSAVDARVGKHLFENCIKDFLKEKTCILVTHQTQYLTDVDQIVLMENAKVLREGSYRDLRTSNLNFTKSLGSSTETENRLLDDDREMEKSVLEKCFRKTSGSSVYNAEETKTSEIEHAVESVETRASGNMKFNLYLSYILAGGSRFKLLSLLLVCILTQALASGGDYWITHWVQLEDHVFRTTKVSMPTSSNTSTTSLTIDSSDVAKPWIVVSRNTCVIVFSVFTLLIIVSAFAESALLISVCTTSSMNLHDRMFSTIIRATMNFFNKNPSGRILNRFSKDIGVIDELLPSIFIDVVQFGMMVIGVFIVVGIVNPYLIPPTVIIVIVFFKLRKLYMTTTRNVKRLEGVAQSPIFTHVNSSIRGLATIRAFEVEQILSREFASHQDLHSSAWYLFLSLSRAFSLWIDLVSLFYVCVVTFCFIIIVKDTYGGNVGLAITQAIGLMSLFQWVVRQSAELENQMTSVERVVEYTNVPHESAFESIPYKKPPKEWPDKGRILFKHFYMRYECHTPFVLKNLNLTIEPSEKIGIVGRTGAGKSSLIAALFRLALNEGNIIVDGVEVHELGLHDLRSKISIIPQEPVLFSGTIRKNLDPYDEHPDHVLWKALEEVELKYVVDDLCNGLNSEMSEGGSNFSVGQRQLLCLARAIVRNNKILVLDEATANVDPRTDALIQNTIRNKFRMCTVLTIAHRLNTVMDSDRILVMEAGSAVEFDHPHVLLKNKHGYLYKMVKQTGYVNADLLRGVAAQNFNMQFYSQTKFVDENDYSDHIIV